MQKVNELDGQAPDRRRPASPSLGVDGQCVMAYTNALIPNL
jgi:hypothetical protein